MKHIKKRVAALLLTLAMVLSLAPMAFAADEFPDMPAEDDPSYAAVKSAIDNKIMTGENGELKLEGTILRSTVAKMVVTAFAAKGEADLSGYPDVDSEAWYAAWMAKANQMGIMTGTSGKMNPSNEVTLAEVAAMLCRALGLPTDEDAAIDGVAAWAAPYVKALIDAGYITAEDAAAAHEPMTRGNFAEVIYKVSGEGNYAKEENAEITEDVNGNIVITANGVSLKGITVKGDIIIADGVDAGSVVLDDVKVEGRIVVRGAGAELTNGTTASATVVAATTGETTVKADAGSDAGDIAVAGTNGMAADKVVLDMAEPKATVTAATELAVQNAEGGEITLQAPNASLSVESGSVANVTVADGASGVKVDVAEGATIDKVTTNTDLAITGEGTVSEKEGSGTVTDGSGNEVSGSDEPVDVPTVSEPAPEVDPNAPTNPTHTHNYTGGTVAKFDATRHTIQCVGTPAVGDDPDADDYVAAVPCSAVIYEAHNTDGDEVKDGDTVIGHKCTCGYSAVVTSSVDEGDGDSNCADGKHSWEPLAGQEASDAGDSAATCTAPGQKSYKCKVAGCTATKTEVLPATDHSFSPSSTTAPSCNTPGKTVFTCTNAGCDTDSSAEGAQPATKEQVIPATGNHNWELDASDLSNQPATCMKGGKALYVCTTCTGADNTHVTKLQDTPINPTAHKWEGGTVTKDTSGLTHTIACANKDADENACSATKTVSCTFSTNDDAEGNAPKAATCTEAGKTQTKKCACGNTHYDVIPALGHDVVWVTTATTHKKICSRSETCGAEAEVAEANHTWSDGKGAKDAVCTVCGYKNGGSSQPAEHQHSWTRSDADGICDNADGLNENCTQAHDCTAWNTTDHGCTVCGKPHSCQTADWNQTTTCTKCNKTHEHNTSGADGACSTCGYKASAPAPNPGT